MDATAQLAIAQYYRRKLSLAQLVALADGLIAGATAPELFTSLSLEGGIATAALGLTAAEHLAIVDLIAEMDTTVARPPATIVRAGFGSACL